jgi:hypothetical protein
MIAIGHVASDAAPPEHPEWVRARWPDVTKAALAKLKGKKRRVAVVTLFEADSSKDVIAVLTLLELAALTVTLEGKPTRLVDDRSIAALRRGAGVGAVPIFVVYHEPERLRGFGALVRSAKGSASAPERGGSLCKLQGSSGVAPRGRFRP